MIFTRPLIWKLGLAVAGFLIVASLCSGCRPIEVPCQKSSPLSIHLAVGTFDPLSESGPMALPPGLSLQNYPKGEAGYYILQFKGPVRNEWKTQVAAAGARLFDYVPQFAFIAKMDDRARDVIRAMEPVRWIGIYQPGYRIAPDLRACLANLTDRPVDLIISAFPGEDLSSLTSQVTRLGGDVADISRGNDRVRLTIAARRISDVSRLTGVKWIERVPEFELFHPTSERPQE
jgi:serine protease AprX